MTLAERARAVRLAAFDVDGVLTDGTLFIGPQGEAFKPFNILDGHGIRMLQSARVVVAIITGRSSEAVAWRARELGIEEVVQGCKDKAQALAAIAARHGATLAECSFMGDDLPDLEPMRRCGLAVTVPNAVAGVKAVAHHVTRAHGGHGAVREFCDLLLALRDGQLAAAGAVEPR